MMPLWLLGYPEQGTEQRHAAPLGLDTRHRMGEGRGQGGRQHAHRSGSHDLLPPSLCSRQGLALPRTASAGSSWGASPGSRWVAPGLHSGPHCDIIARKFFYVTLH
jgi:hypothetical protein